METVHTSETSMYFYETRRRHIPECCHLHTRRLNNLKSHSFLNLPTLMTTSPSDFSERFHKRGTTTELCSHHVTCRGNVKMSLYRKKGVCVCGSTVPRILHQALHGGELSVSQSIRSGQSTGCWVGVLRAGLDAVTHRKIRALTENEHSRSACSQTQDRLKYPAIDCLTYEIFWDI
jgi:hypothetical protein